LARGQVGTVVELLDRKTVLVEFADEQGQSAGFHGMIQLGLS
jgi:hypothetical protein